MTDSELKVLIQAEVGDYLAGMQEAASQTATASTEIASSLESMAAKSQVATTKMVESTESAANGMTGAFLRINEAGERLNFTLRNLGEIFLIGGLIEVGHKLYDTVESTTELEETLLHLSQRTGLTVDQLNGLRGVAEVADVSMDTFARSITMLSRQMVQAEQGSKRAQEAFAAFGLSVDELKGKSPHEVFLEIAEALSHTADGMEKTGAAAELLGGRMGTQLLPVMAAGREGIEQLESAFKALNPITKEQTEEAEQLHKSWLADKEAAASFATSLTSLLAPQIEKLNKVISQHLIWLSAWSAAVKEGGFAELSKILFGDTSDVEARFNRLTGAAKALTDARVQAEKAPTIEPNIVSAESAAEAKKAWADVWADGSFGKSMSAAMDRELSEIARKIEAMARKSAEEVKRWDNEAEKARAENVKAAIKDYRDYEKEVEKANAELQQQFSHLFDPLVQAFETTVQGVILGTEKIGRAFSRLAVSLGLESAKSLLEAALGGANKNSPLAAIFGTAGQAGTGSIGNLSEAFTKALPQITQLFKQAFPSSDILSSVTTLFSKAFGGLSSAGSSIMAFLPQIASLVPFFFEKGGIVPSAAGGMVVGGGGTLAMLHPREVVLPANIAQRFISASEPGGGGDMHTHVHLHATDARSFMDRLDEHADTIANAVVRAHRDGHRGLNNALGRVHSR